MAKKDANKKVECSCGNPRCPISLTRPWEARERATQKQEDLAKIELAGLRLTALRGYLLVTCLAALLAACDVAPTPSCPASCQEAPDGQCPETEAVACICPTKPPKCWAASPYFLCCEAP